MQLTDKDGNIFGTGGLEITTSNGKPKVPVINTDITIGTTVIVGGTVGRVLFQGAGNVVQQAAGLFYDAPNVRFGVGTSSPAYNLDVVGNASITTNLSVGSLGTDGIVYLNRASTGGNVGGIRAQASGSEICGGGFVDRILCSNGAGLFFYTYGGSGSVSTQRMQIFGTSGNVLIQSGGTFTDAGFKLDVNGSVTFRGELRLNANIATGGNRNYLLGNSGDFEVTTNTAIKFRNFYNASDVYFSMNYGLGGRALFSGLTSGTGYRLATSGNVIPEATVARGVFFNNTLVASANNDVLIGLDIAPTFANGAFTGVTNVDLRTKNAGVVIGANYGYGALYGYGNDGIVQVRDAGTGILGSTYSTQLVFRPAGNSAGLNSNYWAYLEQSATAFLLTSGRYQPLYLRAGTGGSTNDMFFQSSTNTVMMIKGTTSNVLIGTTTDSGFKFDVNGTARATGVITGYQFNASYNGGSYSAAGVVLLDYGDGLRIGYSGSVQKITLFTAAGTPRFQVVNSGSILIGTTTEIASSLLTLNSSTRGFLPPRMTNAEMLAIATPATSLMVYDTTNNKLCCYDGTTWQNLF